MPKRNPPNKLQSQLASEEECRVKIERRLTWHENVRDHISSMSRLALEEAAPQLPAWLVLESQSIPWPARQKVLDSWLWTGSVNHTITFWGDCSSIVWDQIGLFYLCLATEGQEGSDTLHVDASAQPYVGKQNNTQDQGQTTCFAVATILLSVGMSRRFQTISFCLKCVIGVWMWFPWVPKVDICSDFLFWPNSTHISYLRKFQLAGSARLPPPCEPVHSELAHSGVP